MLTGRAGAWYSSEYSASPSLVGGEAVQTLVADERGGAGDRVQGPLDHGPDGLLGLASRRPRRRAVCSAGEIAQMGTLGVVELKRPSQCLQHALRDAVDVAALQTGVVGDAYPGQDGDLLPAQPRNATGAVRGQPGLVWGDPGAA